MELTAIADNVYACLQQDRGWGWSNSGFVNAGGGLVIDTFFDLPKTAELIECYATVTSKPARRLVNTHHNGDHCWGNQLFEGAEIIGHRECAKAMVEGMTPETMQAMIASGDGTPGLKEFLEDTSEFDFSGIEITPPNRLVDEWLVLDLDDISAEIVYVGPAHTIGDVIVHLPAEGVVFGGDVLWRNCTPLGWEGTYEKWLSALDFVLGLEPGVVVPGHGPITDADGVRELKAYLEYVRAESKVHFDAGLNELDAAKKIDLGPYADWTEPERLIFNVHRAYREFRDEPHDAPINIIELFLQMGGLLEHMRGC